MLKQENIDRIIAKEEAIIQKYRDNKKLENKLQFSRMKEFDQEFKERNDKISLEYLERMKQKQLKT